MTIIKIAAIMAVVSGLVISGDMTAEAGKKECPAVPQQQTYKVCGKTAPNVRFSGDRQIVKPIKVQVCHPYWDRLDVGMLNGKATKWWGPTIRYKKWQADLSATDEQCKTFWVKPGTVIDSFASCVNRIIRTENMYRSGTYWMN